MDKWSDSVEAAEAIFLSSPILGIYRVIDSNQLSNCLSNNQCRRLFPDEVHGNYISRTHARASHAAAAVLSSSKIHPVPVHLASITLNTRVKYASTIKRPRTPRIFRDKSTVHCQGLLNVRSRIPFALRFSRRKICATASKRESVGEKLLRH